MSGGRIRKLAVVALIGAGVAAAVKALRGEPTPVYSNHPSVNGGPTTVAAAAEPSTLADATVDAATGHEARAAEPTLVAVPPLPEVSDVVADDPEPVATEPVAEPAAADEPATLPAPTAGAGAAGAPTGEENWVDPVDGTCPEGYPIKAKLKSGIYHQPGSTTYERTKPDRCYPSVEAAEADGLRPPKR